MSLAAALDLVWCWKWWKRWWCYDIPGYTDNTHNISLNGTESKEAWKHFSNPCPNADKKRCGLVRTAESRTNTLTSTLTLASTMINIYFSNVQAVYLMYSIYSLSSNLKISCASQKTWCTGEDLAPLDDFEKDIDMFSEKLLQLQYLFYATI